MSGEEWEGLDATLVEQDLGDSEEIDPTASQKHWRSQAIQSTSS